MLPDMAGFEDAQDRLRQALGRVVTFHTRVPAVYPLGTRLDRETGEPMDPTIQPSSGGGFTDVDLKVGVIERQVSPARPHLDVQATPIGPMEDTVLVLDVDVTDWPSVEDATEVTDLGVRYEIVEARPSGVVDEDRVIVYCEEK